MYHYSIVGYVPSVLSHCCGVVLVGTCLQCFHTVVVWYWWVCAFSAFTLLWCGIGGYVSVVKLNTCYTESYV